MGKEEGVVALKNKVRNFSQRIVEKFSRVIRRLPDMKLIGVHPAFIGGLIAATFLVSLFVLASLLGAVLITVSTFLLGGFLVAFGAITTPYIVLTLRQKLRRHRKRRARRKRVYPIHLVTENPPFHDMKALRTQADRIGFIIRDLRRLCDSCITKKCLQCRIEREIVPTLEKVRGKIG